MDARITESCELPKIPKVPVILGCHTRASIVSFQVVTQGLVQCHTLGTSYPALSQSVTVSGPVVSRHTVCCCHVCHKSKKLSGYILHCTVYKQKNESCFLSYLQLTLRTSVCDKKIFIIAVNKVVLLPRVNLKQPQTGKATI